MLGNFAAAERAEAEAIAARNLEGAATGDRRRLAELKTWMAMAQARQGHLREAAATIAPVVALRRQLLARNRGDQWLPLELATGLYVQSIALPGQHVQLLNEARALFDAAPAAVKATWEGQFWQARLRESAASRT
ncbi:MAG: hypothetical protein JO005_04295 [Gammaproteobacteria bacterium]|nr:hypothetical protein [Gammaproteobacteria bacterium]